MKTFCTKKIAITWPRRSADQAYVLVQRRNIVGREGLNILSSSLCTKAESKCDSLYESGFPRTVFTDEKCHIWVKVQMVELSHCGNVKRVRIEVFNLIAF